MTTRFVLVCSLLLALGSAHSADQKRSKEQQLANLKTKIEKLRKTIEVKENSKSSYTRQLRQIEKQIGQISRHIRQSNRQIRKRQKDLDELQQEKVSIQRDIDAQNDNLSRQLHAAYTLGQQEQLKLLLSQEDATTLQRNLTYYEYFSRYRLNLINNGRENYRRLLANEQLISEAKAALERELQTQQQKKAELTRDSRKRKQIVAELEQELAKQGNRLSELEEDARNLRQLIDQLSDILDDVPEPTTSQEQFANLRGKLAWPVKGKVKKLFGKPKPPSSLRWQGVLIEAPMGNNVRAVSHGRVAFADWLRGMGNLIIIDHGKGYLSLYGHNQSLFKSAGEWVEPGDIIASIGNSGGQKEPALYFEIRRKGKPQNPSRWCDAANWFAT